MCLRERERERERESNDGVWKEGGEYEYTARIEYFLVLLFLSMIY